MEDDPFMSLALKVEASMPEKLGGKVPLPNLTGASENKINGATRNPLSAIPGTQLPQSKIGVIPLSRPDETSGTKLRNDAIFRPKKYQPGGKMNADARGYNDRGQGSLIQRYSGLKVKNPLVSRSQLECRLAQTSIMPLAQLRSRHFSAGLGPSWCTICAVGEISPTRESASGGTYSIWKVTDLDQTSVSLFLFGQAHRDLSGQAQAGSIIAILTARVRAEGGDFSLNVEKGDQVLVLGIATEFGYCKATQKNGQPCKIPVNTSRCPYCSYHVGAEFQRLRPKRIELQGNALKTAFQNGMKRKLHWQPGQFRTEDHLLKSSMPTSTPWQLHETAAKAAGRGSAAGARYVKTVANPDAARAEAANVENMKLRRNKLAAGIAPIPLARTLNVVMEPSRKLQQQTGGTKPRKSSSEHNCGRIMLPEKRKLHAQEQPPPPQQQPGNRGDVMVTLEDDDIFAGGDASMAVVGDARQRAVEILKSTKEVDKSGNASSTKVPGFLAASLQDRSEHQQQQQQEEAKEKELNVSRGTISAQARRPAVGRPAMVQQQSLPHAAQPQRAYKIKKPAPQASVAPVTGFAAAFGSVISEMEAQECKRVDGGGGSLYRDLVEEEDAERMAAMMDVLEKKDDMAAKMDSIKTLAVTAWQCSVCNITSEWRPAKCASSHPTSLRQVQATKRWWQCDGCKRRFCTVGVRYPCGPCPKCDIPGTEFTAVSMLKPQHVSQQEIQQSGIASKEQLLARGVEQKWVNE